MNTPDSSTHDGLLDALRLALGDARVSTDPELLEQRGGDMWPLRLLQQVLGQARSRPRASVQPTSVDEVQKALRLLTARRVPVVPHGGGSGVVGGADAPTDAVVLDLSRLDRILALDEDDLLVHVQAGVGLAALEAWLGERGYTTGHYPQSIALAQIGGLVATRSSGQFSTKYGNIEDIVAGLEVVLPSGELVRMSPAPRRSVGPDLRQLWIGSEGAFGVITEVSLKIVPRPEERELQAYALRSFDIGLDSIRRTMRAGWRPAVVRLHDAHESRRNYAGLVADDEAVLLLLSEGPRGQANTELNAIAQILAAQGARPLGPEPVQSWLERRNDIEHYEALLRAGTLIDTIEVAAGWRAIARIHAEITARLPREIGELKFVSAHSSHSYPQGTNLYFSLAARPPHDPVGAEDLYRRIWALVMEITLHEGGTIAHHHGIGRLRAPWVARDLGSAMRLLEVIKEGVDPHGVMNPGALLPRSPG